jgi:hypothetical protein
MPIDGDFHAFPTSTVDGFTQHGMMIRDYFGAHFMATTMQMSEHNMNAYQAFRIAEFAYVVADAMLRARSQPNSET